jgi:hypothetical protein
VIALPLIFRQYRHESLGKRALTKDASKKIGDLKRHDENVHPGAGTKEPGEHDIAQKSHDSGGQRHTANDSGRFG